MAVRGVTFDLDDTLWCGATVIRRASDAFHAFLERRVPLVARNFPPAEFYRLLGRLQKELPHKAHDYTFLRKHALRHCIGEVGGAAAALQLTEEDEAALEAFLEEAFLAFLIPRSQPDFFDGVDVLLQQLHDELRVDADGVVSKRPVMGVITNGNCMFEQLPEFFRSQMDFMVSAESAGVAKPDSKIFDVAFAKFEQPIARHEIVHVGDHYDADVTGAKRAGFLTIWIDAKREKPDAFHRRDLDSEDAARFPEADAIVTHVRAVVDVIRRWNQEHSSMR